MENGVTRETRQRLQQCGAFLDQLFNMREGAQDVHPLCQGEGRPGEPVARQPCPCPLTKGFMGERQGDPLLPG